LFAQSDDEADDPLTSALKETKFDFEDELPSKKIDDSKNTQEKKRRTQKTKNNLILLMYFLKSEIQLIVCSVVSTSPKEYLKRMHSRTMRRMMRIF